jgi:hypothetical protein
VQASEMRVTMQAACAERDSAVATCAAAVRHAAELVRARGPASVPACAESATGAPGV